MTAVCSSRVRRFGRSLPGFTLVELLVVIGIIALLISILLPSLNRAREMANNVKCQANLRAIGQGLQLYAAENRDRILFGFWNEVNAQGQQIIWHVALKNFLSQRGQATGGAVTTNESAMALTESFRCPSAAVHQGHGGLHHYSANPAVMHYRAPFRNPGNPNRPNASDAAAGNTSAFYTEWWQQGYRFANLKSRSTEVFLVADGTQNFNDFQQGNADAVLFNLGEVTPTPTTVTGQWTHTGPNMEAWMIKYADGHDLAVGRRNMDSVPISHQNRDGVGGGGEPNTAEVWRGNLRYRHGGGTTANFLFGDGHVESLSISRDFQTNQLKWRNVRAN